MKTFNCVLCSASSAKKTKDVTRDYKDDIVACNKCGHIQVFPLPTQSEEKNFYNNDKQTKLLTKKISTQSLRRKSEWDTNRRANYLANNYKKNSKILDYGSGYGFFLNRLQKIGFVNISAFEISEERNKIAKRQTKAVFISSEDKLKKGYNIITLFHVLEHVRNPQQLCINLNQALAKRGVLIIEIPNANDSLLYESPAYRSFFWQRAHISYFNRYNVQSLLKKAGFKKVKIKGVQRYGFENAANWLRNGKPELVSPTYSTVNELSWLETMYKREKEKKFTSDTLWIEAIK